MKELVLITGASYGIGAAMAKIIAAKKYDLVLVARTMEKLQALQQELTREYGVTIHVIAKDLSVVENSLALYEEVKHRGLDVTMLVNNAGFGVYGDFSDTDLNAELRMINVNIASVVALTKLFMQDMLIRKQGRIMNIASLLSYLPFPYFSVYSATKSFILAFSETIAAELDGTGVIVTTLCPGPVDTPFSSDAMWKTNAYKTNKPVDPVVVAKEGVQLLLSGKGKKIVGFNNWFISNLPRITPDRIMMKIKKNLASQAS